MAEPAAPGGRGEARAALGLAGCAAAIGYALGYALPAYARLANLYYDPSARRFTVGARSGPVPMGYYGQLVYGAVLGLALGLVTYVIARRAPPGSRALGLASAWALTAVFLVGAWFTWNNWP